MKYRVKKANATSRLGRKKGQISQGRDNLLRQKKKDRYFNERKVRAAAFAEVQK